MKVVHASWEKRNLGIDCNEVEIESHDTVEAIENDLLQAETEYTVAKIPAGMIEILFYVQRKGYYFIETMTSCYHAGESFSLTPAEMRFVNRIRYEEMTSQDRDYVFSRIEEGLFETDRIALDPCFTKVQANQRYIGWISDELERGASLFKLMNLERPVGFFCIKSAGAGICFAFLGGIYPEFARAGFGVPMNFYEIEEGMKRGAKRILSSYSSNNRGAAAIHLKMGYVLIEQYHVLVKHVNAKI